MESEILTSLADKGAIGVSIIALGVVVYLVNLFLKYIKSESKLSRESQANEAKLSREAHKETAKLGADALKEVAHVVAEFHKSNQDAHNKIIGDIAKIN